MRFAIAVLACVLAVANAQYNPFQKNVFGQYQPGQYQQGQYNRYQPFKKFQPTPFPPRPTPFSSVPVTPAPAVFVSPVVPPRPSVVPVAAVKVVSDARSAETLRSGNEVNPDGTYNYFYETSNGIAAQAQGTPRNLGGNPPVVPDVVQGSFSWVSPEGKPITVTYVADENGYQPQSDVLPVAPEVPPQIARALAYIAKYQTQ